MCFKSGPLAGHGDKRWRRRPAEKKREKKGSKEKYAGIPRGIKGTENAD